MNTKVIEGLRAMNEGFNLLIEGLSESISTAVSEEVVEKPKKSKKSEPVKEVETETEATSEYTEEELNSMSYNELKKLAKELGISATGNRKELVKKLLSGETDETDEEDESVEEEAPKKSTKTKASKKKPEPVEDDEDEDEDESEDEEDEDETDSIAEQVNELVADMTDEEIRELLESVDISSKGKREALISKVITAVSEGLISLEDEEDEDTDSEDDADDEEEEAPKKPAKSKKSGDITETMTKKRKKAYKELCDETNEQFENEEITREDLIDFINEYNGTKDKMKKVSDEDLLAQYLEISAMLIDDDGEIVEEGAYYINDEPYCCGHPLTYNKKKKQYVCEHCGAEYDEE